MVTKVYHSRPDLKMYLNETIVMYKGEPHMVNVKLRDERGKSMTDNKRIQLRHLSADRPAFETTTDDKDLVTKNFSLGFCNYNGRAYLISRRAGRRQRDGLCSNAITYEHVGKKDPRGLDFYSMLHSASFAACLRDEYPSYENALDKIFDETKRVQSIAFSKDFALVKLDRFNVGIYYRSTQIAYANRKSRNANFLESPNISFMMKRLDALGVEG